MTAGPKQAQHPGFSSYAGINYSAGCFCVCHLNDEGSEAACMFHRKSSDVFCGAPAWKWLRWGGHSLDLTHTRLIATSVDTIRTSSLAHFLIRVVYSAEIFIKKAEPWWFEMKTGICPK